MTPRGTNACALPPLAPCALGAAFGHQFSVEMGLLDCVLGTYLCRTLRCVVRFDVCLALWTAETPLALDANKPGIALQFFLIEFRTSCKQPWLHVASRPLPMMPYMLTTHSYPWLCPTVSAWMITTRVVAP